MDKLTRRYTITIEVEGAYADQVEEPPHLGGIYPGHALRLHANQHLAALLLNKHRPVLERLMRKWVMETVFSDTRHYEAQLKQVVPDMHDTGENEGLLERLLEPVIADLPAAERAYALGCIRDVLFFDNFVGALYDSHHVEVTRVTLQESEV